MKKFCLSLLLLVVLSSCIQIPKEHFTISQRKGLIFVQPACNCDVEQFQETLNTASEKNRELNGSGFKLMNWNMYKCKQEGWEKDFKRLSKKRDLIIIQEAHLTEAFQETLNEYHYNWDISTAFRYRGSEAGVLTASKSEPLFTCTLRAKEPIIKVPKTALITVYKLSGTEQTLMVVNIHSINFTLGTSGFSKQLREIENIMLQHPGPLIVSGDINTWSKKRMAIMEGLSNRLNLSAVTFVKNNRKKIFGNDIDHIYYRGLIVSEAIVLKVQSSDHNPMLVDFRLEIKEE